MKTRNQSLLLMLFLLAFQSSVLGQEAREEREPGSTSLSVTGGVWTSGEGGWPLGVLRIDRRLNHDFVLDGAFIGISRPGGPCSGGGQGLGCGDRELISMTLVGLRFEPEEGRLRPTSEINAGWMRYGGDGGAVLSVGAGARLDINSRVGLLGEGALAFLANSGGPDTAALFACGVFVRL